MIYCLIIFQYLNICFVHAASYTHRQRVHIEHKNDAKGLRVNIGNKYDRVIIAFLAKSRRETLRLRHYKRGLVRAATNAHKGNF